MNSSRRICRPCQLAVESFLHKSQTSTTGVCLRRQSTSAKDAIHEDNGPASSSSYYSAVRPKESVLSTIIEDVEIPQKPTAIKAEGILAKEIAMYNFIGGKVVNSWISKDMDLPSKQAASPETAESQSPIEQVSTIDAFHPMKPLSKLDPGARVNCMELIDLLIKYRQHSPSLVPIKRILELYDSLPPPRVCFLDRRHLRKLSIIVSRQDMKQNDMAQKYLSIIKEMRSNRTVVRYSEWCALIDAIGQGFLYHKKQSATLAREILKEMEQSGLKPETVVLNQLLQAAHRAKDHELARTIDAEFEKRNLPASIITWTHRIREAGSRKDIKQIHSVFREFFKTGQRVDIVFVNALLEAFLTANQPTFAELIYLRFRALAMNQFQSGRTPRRNDFVAIRKARHLFLDPVATAKEVDEELARRRLETQITPSNRVRNKLLHIMSLPPMIENTLVPNHGTLRLFIGYHTHYTGRLEDVAFYLNDMDGFGVQPNYGYYIDLLHAFFLWHKENPKWNAARLDKLFSFIMKAGKPLIPIRFATALAAIRAFGTVHGGEKAREVWDLLRPWIVLNPNVKMDPVVRLDLLEKVVQKFEAGEELGPDMSGADRRYRIMDWRTTLL
jgi:hypothetical protein